MWQGHDRQTLMGVPMFLLAFEKEKTPVQFPGLCVEHVRLVLGRQALEPRRFPKGQPNLLSRTAIGHKNREFLGTPTAIVEVQPSRNGKVSFRLTGRGFRAFGRQGGAASHIKPTTSKIFVQKMKIMPLLCWMLTLALSACAVILPTFDPY